MKTIIIIHKNNVIFRDENYMLRNYFGNTLDERINDLIYDNKVFGCEPTIIVQGKRGIERIIPVIA